MQRGAVVLSCVVAASVAVLLPARCRAFWPADGRLAGPGLAVTYAACAADGAGGAIQCWTDATAGAVFAQHVLASGELDPAWPVAGRQLTALPGGSFQFDLVCATDGSGGAYVAWHDHRDAVVQVYATRVTRAGAVAPGWPASGLRVSGIPLEATYAPPVAVACDSGGLYLAWEQVDTASPHDFKLYLSRLDSTGVLQPGWLANGNVVCSAAHDQHAPAGVADGAGGVVLAWLDSRDNPNSDLYALRMTPGGAPAAGWTPGGTPIFTAAAGAADPRMVPDGAGGAVIAFRVATGSQQRLVAAHASAGGTADWSPAGVPLSTTSVIFDPDPPAIATDGAGGALVAWGVYGQAGDVDVAVNRVTASGVRRLPAGGLVLCAAAHDQEYPALVADGRGGAVATWPDARSGTRWDLYAQAIDSTVTPRWAPDGIPLCLSHAVLPAITAASDSAHGALISWIDDRSNFDSQGLYAARVNGAGVTGPTPVAVSGFSARMQDGAVRLTWTAYAARAGEFRVLRADTREGPYAPVGGPVQAPAGTRILHADDTSARPGRESFYRLEWREDSGWAAADVLEFRAPAARLALWAVSAQPARGSVELEYEVERAGRATLSILDACGTRVRTIAITSAGAGAGRASWDGLDARGAQAPAGVYFARLSTATGTARCKLLRFR